VKSKQVLLENKELYLLSSSVIFLKSYRIDQDVNPPETRRIFFNVDPEMRETIGFFNFLQKGPEFVPTFPLLLSSHEVLTVFFEIHHVHQWTC
jgi:hypothetical protein